MREKMFAVGDDFWIEIRALRVAPAPLLAEEAGYFSAAEHGAFVEHTRESLPLRVAFFKDRPTEVV